MKPLKIAIGADHAGFTVKNELVKQLTEEGYKVIDYGAYVDQSTDDYPDFAFKVARAVGSGRCDRGLLACGSGIGMAMAANKMKGVRAAPVWSSQTARLASQHNWANILCLSSRFNSLNSLKKMTRVWLQTPYEKGGRHERRVKKIIKIEAKIS